MQNFKIKKIILDTLFPIFCLSCQKQDVWLCKECQKKIEIIFPQVCPYCEKVSSSAGAICPDCQNRFWRKNKIIPLDNLIAAVRYNKNSISRAVYAFKYNFVEDLSAPLSDLIIQALFKNNLPVPDIIIPVPLHKRRLRWRGFNQAELLAKHIGENLAPGFSIPVFSDLIVRQKFTPPQMKIKNYQERQKNLQDAFVLNSKENFNFNKKNILLIDDICTTGSTLLECAKILKSAGAKKICAAVIARQEMNV